MFRDEATEDEIKNTLYKVSEEGVGYWLLDYGANIDVFTPEFAARLKEAEATLKMLRQEVVKRGCVV